MNNAASLVRHGGSARTPWHLRPLLAGVATAALAAAANPVRAIDFTSATDWGNYDDPATWQIDDEPAGVIPTLDDTVTITGGEVDIGPDSQAGTLNLIDGDLYEGSDAPRLTIGRVLTISGGMIEPEISIEAGPPVVSLDQVGNAVVSGVAVTQTGGTMNGTLSHLENGALPANYFQSYDLQGGSMGGSAAVVQFNQSGTGWMMGHVDATTYRFDGAFDEDQERGGLLEGSVSARDVYISQSTGDDDSGATVGDNATIDFTDALYLQGGLISGGALLLGVPQDGSDALAGTIVQTAGDMQGTATVQDYVQSGGSVTGTVNAETYAYSGGDLDGATLNISAFKQTGGDMAATLIGLDRYVQSGGTISGHVSADIYELAAGTADDLAHVTIGKQMVQSGGTMDKTLAIGTYAQTGGLMNGTLTGLATYSQSGGEMASTLTGLDRYVQSGGTITGHVDTDIYELAGGTADDLAHLTIGSQIVQSGGTMDKAASVATYTQTGGTMSGAVSSSNYDISGGTIAGTGQVTVDGEITLSGTAHVDKGGQFWAANTLPTNAHGDPVYPTVTEDGADTVFDGLVGAVDAEGYLIGTPFTSYTLNAGTVGEDAVIATGDLFNQNGGTMDGIANTWTYNLNGGTMGGDAEVVDFNLSGTGTIAGGGKVDFIHQMTISGGTVESGANIVVQDWGDPDNGIVAQTGGTMNGTVVATTHDVPGRYSQSGGSLGGRVTTDTYELTSAAATSTSTATIDASTAFALKPPSGKATVDARLTGTGKLTKSGLGSVVLTNAGNDFSGGIAIEAGTLQALNDALPDNAAVTIAQNAALQITISKDIVTSFNGAISGTNGLLVKDGAGTLALGKPLLVGKVDVDAGTLHLLNGALPGTGDIEVAKDATLQVTVDSGKSATYAGTLTGDTGKLVKDGAGTLTLTQSVTLGALDVTAGTLNIGAGVDPESNEVASFESTVIGSGATVYVAKYATLTIRVPHNIVNNGFLINDGTVNDDLDNNATFNNNAAYNANVASNTGNINNNTPGIWTGNVVSNAGSINNNADAEWDGKVLDNYGAIHNVAGTWKGDVVDNHGDLMNDNLGDEVGIGYWYGNVVANHDSLFNAGGGYWSGDVQSNNGYIKNDRTSGYAFASGTGTGVARWTGNVYGNGYAIENRGLWTGSVVGNAAEIDNTGRWVGTVTAGNTGLIFNAEDDYNVAPSDKVRAAWLGDVVGNSGTIVNMGADWTGDVQANTGSITNTGGQYNQVLVTSPTWIGKVVTNAGTITNAAGSTWTGDVLANTGTIDTAGLWTGNFANSAGGTAKARNQIIGTLANAGTLRLTGNLSGITALTNTGLLDLRNGTTAGQSLTAGSVDLQPGSTMAVSVDSAGNTDQVSASGAAALGGTVKLTLNPITGNYDYGKTYTILTAGSRSGTFSGVTSDLAFLEPQLSYRMPGVVTLNLQRNGETFEQVGTTSNQKATGAAVEALGTGNPVYGAVLGLTTAEAQGAFDQLSGAAQGATQTADMTAANIISNVLVSRIDQAFDAIGGGDNSGRRVNDYVAGPQIVSSPDPTGGIWGQFYGAVGSSKGNAAIAGSTSSTGGIALGLDGQLADWRAGIVVQAGTSGTTVPDLNSTSTSFDYGAGLYAGGDLGRTRLSFGASYTQHAVNSTRHVAFPGFDETLSAAYGAETAQAFAQISQDIDFGATAVTPYANMELVANRTDAYTEKGGAAALTSAANLIDATFATLGLDVSHQMNVGDGMMLTIDGGLGWRHTFAGTPSVTRAFAGGTAFPVLGAPLPSELALVSAGLNLDITDTTTIDLSYDGQFSPGALAHSLRATWNSKF